MLTAVVAAGAAAAATSLFWHIHHTNAAAAAAATTTTATMTHKDDDGDAPLSTTSTGTGRKGGGVAMYENKKAVDEYLQFHFGAPHDILPYACGPTSALGFPARCAALCAKHADTHGAALDIGCAVGGASFELAKAFDAVVGLDYSHAFIDAAKAMQRHGTATYTALLEGSITARVTTHTTHSTAHTTKVIDCVHDV